MSKKLINHYILHFSRTSAYKLLNLKDDIYTCRGRIMELTENKVIYQGIDDKNRIMIAIPINTFIEIKDHLSFQEICAELKAITTTPIDVLFQLTYHINPINKELDRELLTKKLELLEYE